MPQIRYYKVIETRVVEVTANSPQDAVAIGAAAFNNGQNSDSGVKDGPHDVWGNTTEQVRTVRITAEEIR